ncbi:hypothetical protein [Allorhodopirellula solitaria]|uniref:Uncharacterized protein n=1 Tax=Allorhodopirellula solitaria TaxID=2527987 RepID=A0A5C5XVR2_9BACT|nr:hypothetical protein [Allorhodopirellula solitaria]TWT66611.1 hypothetical protein CA85_27080 [Allorhodopirellula solitaria]
MIRIKPCARTRPFKNEAAELVFREKGRNAPNVADGHLDGLSGGIKRQLPFVKSFTVTLENFVGDSLIGSSWTILAAQRSILGRKTINLLTDVALRVSLLSSDMRPQ